jgi:hypothetical protein
MPSFQLGNGCHLLQLDIGEAHIDARAVSLRAIAAGLAERGIPAARGGSRSAN